MTIRTKTSHRLIRRTVVLAALSLATFAWGGTGRAAASSQLRDGDGAVIASGLAAENHPLDEATVRKLVAIMRAWQPERRPSAKNEDPNDLLSAMERRTQNRFIAMVQRDLAVRNSTATIDATAPLKAAIVGHGLSSREFAVALLAFEVARQNDDLRTYLKATGGTPAELPPVLQRNIEIIRRVGPREALPSW